MERKGILGTLKFMFFTILVLVLTCSAVVITVLNAYKPAVKVYVADEFIGYFSNEQHFSEVYNDLVTEKELTGLEVKVYLDSEPTFETSYIRDSILEEQNVYTNLRAVLKTEYTTYSVAVNDEEEMTFSTHDEAANYTQKLKDEVASLNVEIIEEKSEELEELTTIERADNILKDIVDRNKPVEIPKPVVTGYSSDYPVIDNISDPFKDNGVFPADSRYLTSYYGWRWGSFHTGIDIAGPIGTNIYAYQSGTVTYSGWSGAYGYLVKIDHGDGHSTWYAHCSKLNVNTGDKVSKGQVIALMGSTGFSTGSHLHFEVRINGVHVNPYTYIYQYM